MLNETRLDNMNDSTKRVKLGKRMRLITELTKLLSGGTGVVNQHTMGNTTTTLALGILNYVVNGVPVRKASGTTALTATGHDVQIDKWASYRVSGGATGTITITKQSAAEDDTEQEAIANVVATPANEANLGYFVVRGGTAAIFDATTNNLQTAAVAGMVVRFFPSTAVLSEAITSLS